MPDTFETYDLACRKKMTPASRQSYEIHVTINSDKDFVWEKFASVMVSIGVKPLMIYDIRDGVVFPQIMTSHVVNAVVTDGNYAQLTGEFQTQLTRRGYRISRVKVETSINHPDATAFSGSDGVPYFEAHYKVKECEVYLLYEQSFVGFGLLESVNHFKPQFRFLTFRKHMCSRYSFGVDIGDLEFVLSRCGIQVIERDYEFCLYDSNPD
jgi:hypothetical protein